MNRQAYRLLTRAFRSSAKTVQLAGTDGPSQHVEVHQRSDGGTFVLVRDAGLPRQPVRILNTRAPLSAIMIRTLTGEIWLGKTAERRRYVNLCREMCAGERIPIPG